MSLILGTRVRNSTTQLTIVCTYRDFFDLDAVIFLNKINAVVYEGVYVNDDFRELIFIELVYIDDDKEHLHIYGNTFLPP